MEKEEENSGFDFLNSFIDRGFKPKDFFIKNGFQLEKENDKRTSFFKSVYSYEYSKQIDVQIFIHHYGGILNRIPLLFSVYADGDQIYKGIIPTSESLMLVIMSLLLPNKRSIDIIEEQFLLLEYQNEIKGVS